MKIVTYEEAEKYAHEKYIEDSYDPGMYQGFMAAIRYILELPEDEAYD